LCFQRASHGVKSIPLAYVLSESLNLVSVGTERVWL